MKKSLLYLMIAIFCAIPCFSAKKNILDFYVLDYERIWCSDLSITWELIFNHSETCIEKENTTITQDKKDSFYVKFHSPDENNSHHGYYVELINRNSQDSAFPDVIFLSYDEFYDLLKNFQTCFLTPYQINEIKLDLGKAKVKRNGNPNSKRRKIDESYSYRTEQTVTFIYDGKKEIQSTKLIFRHKVY